MGIFYGRHVEAWLERDHIGKSHLIRNPQSIRSDYADRDLDIDPIGRSLDPAEEASVPIRPGEPIRASKVLQPIRTSLWSICAAQTKSIHRDQVSLPGSLAALPGLRHEAALSQMVSGAIPVELVFAARRMPPLRLSLRTRTGLFSHGDLGGQLHLLRHPWTGPLRFPGVVF